MLATAAAVVMVAAPAAAGVRPHSTGALDCNGHSRIQSTVRIGLACTDPRSIYDGKGARFEDNGHYIGHDEPIVRFLSSRAGSGNDLTWTWTLPREPRQAPTVNTPGSDVTHTFELSAAPWVGMALCNSKSYPLTPCRPRSDTNAASATSPGGGSSFLEAQFYPPGYAPFVDNISCDNTHWCASLHINDLECTLGFAQCNANCEEPTNFAFIQRNGVPTGPPGPQLANVASNTPNRFTLLMNPGDRIRIHIFDAPVPGGHGMALKEVVNDLTTGQTGFMQASAKNGYMATSIKDCSGTPFNYQPEFSTARPANSVPWAALEMAIATQFEIGHFEPCTSVSNPAPFPFPGLTDTMWQTCSGPYESTTGADGSNGTESTSAPCYPKGDTHGGLAPPNTVTGCDAFFGGGDVDFDGTSYWPNWPNSLTPNRNPSTFVEQQPLTRGHSYSQFQFQTDAPASESTCLSDGTGCAVPAPGSPGNFYPWWTLAKVNGSCVWEFGQMRNGNTFGRAAQYGTPSARFFGDLESGFRSTPDSNCRI